MKITALNQKHKDLGAKMVPFAGYEMPVQYTGVNQEHFVVREKVGVFDVSHMGQFFIKGEKATDFLQYILSNDVTKAAIGQAQYNAMPNEKGGIVDDLIIYKISDDEWMAVVNASNIDKDWEWMNKHNTFGVELTNKSDEMSLLAIQGPKAIEAMQALTDVNLSEIPFYHFVIGTFAGFENVIISATGYTGSGDFEDDFDFDDEFDDESDFDEVDNIDFDDEFDDESDFDDDFFDEKPLEADSGYEKTAWEVHISEQLTSGRIIRLMNTYPSLKKITCPPSIYNRISHGAGNQQLQEARECQCHTGKRQHGSIVGYAEVFH